MFILFTKMCNYYSFYSFIIIHKKQILTEVFQINAIIRLLCSTSLIKHNSLYYFFFYFNAMNQYYNKYLSKLREQKQGYWNVFLQGTHSHKSTQQQQSIIHYPKPNPVSFHLLYLIFCIAKISITPNPKIKHFKKDQNWK